MVVDKLLGKRSSIAAHEVQQWAAGFMLVGIDAPILSAYETQETKIPKGKFGLSKKAQVSAEGITREHFDTIHLLTMLKIMDESFVKTGLATEQTLAIESDHPGLCNLNVHSPAFAKICRFIDIGLEDARLKISGGSPRCEFKSDPCRPKKAFENRFEKALWRVNHFKLLDEGTFDSSRDPWSLVSRTRIHDDGNIGLEYSSSR